MRIKLSEMPDARLPQFTIHDGLTYFLPEYWFSVSNSRKALLLKTLNDVGMEYKEYELEDIDTKECRIVARFIEPMSAEAAANVMNFVCHKAGIDSYVISDGSLTSVDLNGEIIGFVSFD